MEKSGKHQKKTPKSAQCSLDFYYVTKKVLAIRLHSVFYIYPSKLTVPLSISRVCPGETPHFTN